MKIVDLNRFVSKRDLKSAQGVTLRVELFSTH